MVTPSSKDVRNQLTKDAHGIANPTRKRLYTLKEAAEYLGRTEWGMRELIWSRSIPVVKGKTGRKIFIDIEDLDAFINHNKTFYS